MDSKAWIERCRKPYPSDVSDEEWALIAFYLMLQREEAGQREHSQALVRAPVSMRDRVDRL